MVPGAHIVRSSTPRCIAARGPMGLVIRNPKHGYDDLIVRSPANNYLHRFGAIEAYSPEPFLPARVAGDDSCRTQERPVGRKSVHRAMIHVRSKVAMKALTDEHEKWR